jgi:hypothetical protein
MLATIQQKPTPLNSLFFSEFNQDVVNRGIREMYFRNYGAKIDYQNKNDVLTLMRSVFIANSANPYGNVKEQVRFMNGRVIEQAVSQIVTGLNQYIGYMRDMRKPVVPPAVPVSTTDYGNKFGKSTKIGL